MVFTLRPSVSRSQENQIRCVSSNMAFNVRQQRSDIYPVTLQILFRERSKKRIELSITAVRGSEILFSGLAMPSEVHTARHPR